MKQSAALVAVCLAEAAALVGGALLRTREVSRPSPSLIVEADLGREASNASLDEGSLVAGLLSGSVSLRDAKIQASKGITFDDALQRLAGKLPSDVESLVKISSKHSLKANRSKKGDDDKEFSEASLAKARVYLNTMIENSQVDLDKITIECKEFEEKNRETFSQVSNDIKRISGQLSDLRRKQIGANEQIRELSRQRRETLSDKRSSSLSCQQARLVKAADLQLKEDDLAVFDFILEATKCAKDDDGPTGFLQVNASDVPDVCSTRDGLVLQFKDPKQQAQLDKIMSHRSQKALRDALAAVPAFQSSLLQASSSSTINTTTVAVPTFTVPAAPVKEEPPKEGQWKKCVNGKPNCGLLHDTMSIQWGVFRDLVDELKYEMRQDKQECDGIRDNLNEQLVIIGEQKTKAMELLTETIASIQEDSQSRSEKQEQYRQLELAYSKKMKECKMTVEEILYTNICAVRQVRDKLMSYSEETPPDAISDCDVEDWTPGDCSVECDDECPNEDPYKCGGWQVLERRAIVAPNSYGVQCPALQMNKKCNQFKCRVNCVMTMWGGWSGCSADCEGGEQQRTRAIYTKPKNGGEECDTTLEARTCNTESCDRDCSLEEWTAWSPCSMACGGGLQERVRKVLVPIRGLGKCPGEHHPDRYELQQCNTIECAGDEICIARQDLVIALDASGSLRQSGFEILRDFTANLTGRYMGTYYGQEAMRVGVLQFGGGKVMKNGVISGAKEVAPLTDDIASLKDKVKELKWQRGITNMAQAFQLASKMLRKGGREGALASVLVITDGKPSMKFVTSQKVAQLKESNTMIYFAPVADFPSPNLEVLKGWASEPWETNYERIPGLLALSGNFEMFGMRLITKFCPYAFSPSRQAQRDKNRGFMLIHENGWPDMDCGVFTLMGNTYQSAEECGLAVKELAPTVYSFAFEYSGRRQGSCYAEDVAVTVELWKQWEKNLTAPECPNGDWEYTPYADTYAIYPVGEDQGEEASQDQVEEAA